LRGAPADLYYPRISAKELDVTKLQFDYTHAFSRGGVAKKDLKALLPRLRQVQDTLINDREAGELGFADLPGDKAAAAAVKAAAKKFAGGVETVLVLGIGGSSLGFIALKEALLHPLHNQLARQKKLPAFYVLDNIDPEAINAVLEVVDPKTTLINVITKSGSTAETMGQFLIFFNLFARKLGGKKKAIKHFVFTTDPDGGSLRPLVEKDGFFALDLPQNVGGRFSVLTPVGLFPAALAGIDITKLLAGAGEALQAGLYGRADKSPSLVGAGLHYLHYAQDRRIAVMMPYANSLYRVGDWFRQLWAESLGKAADNRGRRVNVGPTPVAALGATDQHSQVQLYAEGPDDKFYTFLRVGKMRADLRYPKSPWNDAAFTYFAGHTMFELLEAEAEATRFALSEVGRPSATVYLPKVDEETIGRLLMHLQIQTAAAGYLFDIDPFNQPGVEAGKRYAYGLLGRDGYEKEAAKVKSRKASPHVLEG
jgi:glucose-6-phosphate isomerase